MATVKGDVHDIGKNIVGVVLGCNDYEVIDLGVMVPCEKILKTAREHGVDMIGLSGLITPSLDEMVHVAKEMEREGFTMPLLIGGATTSAKHTAVKIAPSYHGPVVHVKDASRCVGVVDRLNRPETRGRARPREPRASRSSERDSFAQRRQRKLVPYAEALARRFAIDWASAPIAVPCVPRRPTSCDDVPLAELVPYIDWSPFFMTWELKGKYPGDLRRPDRRQGGARALRRGPGAARPDRRREAAHGPRRLRLLPGELRRRRHHHLHRRVADRPSGAGSRCSASSGSARGRRRSAAWPTTSRRSTRAGPITSARSP